MFFQKKLSLPSIQIFDKNICLYDGFIKDIPLKDSIIIENSIVFFNDPEPCTIHRTAVRLRITEELLQKFKETTENQYSQLILDLCPFQMVDKVILKNL